MILIGSSNDYAGLGHSFGNSLRSIGIDCIDVTLSKHPFNYRTESTLVTRETFKTLSQEADHVLICHSCPTLFELNQNPNFSVVHTGTRYRESPEYFNELFQSAKTVLTDQTEFMSLGKMEYVVSGIDSNLYKPKPIGDKLIIGHYPSNPEVKGTSQILEMLKPFVGDKRFEIRLGTNQVSHEEQIKRMQECDIYLELFKPELNGRPYGCFGVTALEASMMGKVVITQDLEEKTYESAYGQHTFINAKNEYIFRSSIDKLGMFPKNTFEGLGIGTHLNIKDRHSYESTGTRLKQLLKL